MASGSYGGPALQRFRACPASSVCSCPLQLSHPGRLITQEYLPSFLLLPAGIPQRASRRTPCLRLLPYTAPQYSYPCQRHSLIENARIDAWQLSVQDPIHLTQTKQVWRFGHIHCYWFRPLSEYRPRVSLSWALPSVFASRGILHPRTYGWHLLGKSESTRDVISFRLFVLHDRRTALSAGFLGSEDQSLDYTLAPILDRFGPSSPMRVSLFDVTTVPMNVCFRYP